MTDKLNNLYISIMFTREILPLDTINLTGSTITDRDFNFKLEQF